MGTFIPYGWKDGNLPLKFLKSIQHEGRKFVICEYGFNYGMFDYLTGAPMAQFNFTNHLGYTDAYYQEVAEKMGKDTIECNANWLDILNSLPVINF